MSIDSVSTISSPPPESRTVEREPQEAPAPPQTMEYRQLVKSSASTDPARGRTLDILV